MIVGNVIMQTVVGFARQFLWGLDNGAYEAGDSVELDVAVD